jgi:L-malate glycosyltransferase
MGNDPKAVLVHIDTERSWRGGQQQLAYLVDGLPSDSFRSIVICQPESPLENYCRRTGIRHHGVAMRHELDLWAAYTIAKRIRPYRSLLIHAHTSHALSIALCLSLFRPGVPIVATRRVGFPRKKNRLSRWKYTNARVSSVVTISDFVRRNLIASGVPDRKMRTIHSGIDLARKRKPIDRTGMKRELGITETEMIIGTVAAMTGDKDYPTLIRAAHAVCEATDKVTFCAIGSGYRHGAVADLIRRHGLERRFILLGQRSDARDLMQLFDLFVLATKHEGLGTSILDAQACGLPVIAANTGGIPEIIEHGRNGYLYTAGDHDELARYLLELIRSEPLRLSFAAKGGESVRRFSIKQTIEQYVSLYGSLL